MENLLIVCGPTATGKTGLALFLAKKFDGELVSADSRQVYKRMDIGTGKDLTEIKKSGVKIWGYDLVEPSQEFNVAHYTKIAQKAIKDIWRRGKLPILVGGTGLYIKSVVDGLGTVNVPKDPKLRNSLRKKGVEELFEMLATVSPVRAASMNASDKKNPRRLVRAIEIALTKQQAPRIKLRTNSRFQIKNTLFIGLKAGKGVLDERIEQRVKKRIRQGIEKEVKGLLKAGVSWDSQAMQSLGYKQWKGFFDRLKSKQEVVEDWGRAEKQYSRRQMVWFKADKRIKWFNVSQQGWLKKVERLVKRWYINDNSNAKKD